MKPFLTRQRLFWFGLGGIVSAPMLVTVSQALDVGSRQHDGVWGFAVVAIDVIAAILILGGITAWVVYHWFPDSTRKYSWRREQTHEPGDFDR